jgi:mRNA-degrading endonuclease toxin of MazEF toxin-antitoxin module
MDAGDIYLADLNDEVRMKVLVASTAQFTRYCDRVFVAPEVPRFEGEVLYPWRVESDGAVFAVDLLRSITADRLLERTGRASPPTIERVRRAIAHITS